MSSSRFNPSRDGIDDPLPIGQVVSPRSLYLQQLRDRLGEQAAINVTTAEQREGRTWTSLSNRARE